jgi:hypothetical protein
MQFDGEMKQTVRWALRNGKRKPESVSGIT